MMSCLLNYHCEQHSKQSVQVCLQQNISNSRVLLCRRCNMNGLTNTIYIGDIEQFINSIKAMQDRIVEKTKDIKNLAQQIKELLIYSLDKLCKDLDDSQKQFFKINTLAQSMSRQDFISICQTLGENIEEINENNPIKLKNEKQQIYDNIEKEIIFKIDLLNKLKLDIPQIFQNPQKQTNISIIQNQNQLISPINSMQFNNTNDILVCGGGSQVNNQYIQIWKRQENEFNLFRTLTGHNNTVNTVCFGKDNSFFSGGNDNKIILWKQSNEHWILAQELTRHIQPVYCLEMNLKCDLLFSGSQNVILWAEDKNGKWNFKQQFEGFQSHIKSLNFNPQNNKLIIGCADKNIKILETQNNELWENSGINFEQQQNIVQFVAFINNYNFISYCEKQFKVWEFNQDINQFDETQTDEKEIIKFHYYCQQHSILIAVLDQQIVIYQIKKDKEEIEKLSVKSDIAITTHDGQWLAYNEGQKIRLKQINLQQY